MLIDIKGLEKAAVFHAFYNRANTAYPISLGEARLVFEAFTRDGDFYFGKIDARTYIEDEDYGDITKYLTGMSIDIDFSGDEIDTRVFDAHYDEVGLGRRIVDNVRTLTATQVFFKRQQQRSTRALIAPTPIAPVSSPPKPEAPLSCLCTIL